MQPAALWLPAIGKHPLLTRSGSHSIRCAYINPPWIFGLHLFLPVKSVPDHDAPDTRGEGRAPGRRVYPR